MIAGLFDGLTRFERMLLLGGIVGNILLWSVTLLVVVVYGYSSEYAGSDDNVNASRIVDFKLYGPHAEDTVSQTLEAVGWNMTIFEPRENNRTILVTAVPLGGLF